MTGLQAHNIPSDIDCLTEKQRIGFLYECSIIRPLIPYQPSIEHNPIRSAKLWQKNIAAGPDIVTTKKLYELKAWAEHYPVTLNMFFTEWVSRFDKKDPDHIKEWVVITSRRNFSQVILDACRLFEIRILYITKESLLAEFGTDDTKYCSLGDIITSGIVQSIVNGGGVNGSITVNSVVNTLPPSPIKADVTQPFRVNGGKGPPDNLLSQPVSDESLSLNYRR